MIKIKIMINLLFIYYQFINLIIKLSQLMKNQMIDHNRDHSKSPFSTNIKQPSGAQISSGFNTYKSTESQKQKGPSFTNINKKLNFNQPSYSYNLSQARGIMKQSQRRVASSISMADLFKENIDNRDFRESAYTKILNTAIQTEQLEQLQNQHRIQIQKLLLEISRLHDVIYQFERSKKYEIQRIKQQCQQMTYLHLSNIKQSQFSQLQILEMQLKKTSQALNQKTLKLQQVQRQSSKDKQMLQSEIELLRNNMKQLINKKNEELFQVQQQAEQKIKKNNKATMEAIEEMKLNCQTEMNKIQRQLKQKEENMNKLRANYDETIQKNDGLEETLQKQRLELQDKLQHYIRESNSKHERLIEHVQHIIQQSSKNQTQRELIIKQIFEDQLNNLIKVIKLKGDENNRIKGQFEIQKLQYKLLKKNYEDENQQLKKLIRKIQLKNLQQIEFLKVRMAILHQNDIKELVKLYETKIECLNQQLGRQSVQTQRLRTYMHEQTHRWYENKKNYEQLISKLNVQVLKLRNGLGNMEKDMKDRFENQRSAMLLTSKSLIRGVQIKNTNAKFFQDEARKLRMTIQKMEHEFQQIQLQLKQQIAKLHQQIKTLVQHNKQNEFENQKTEQQYLKKLQQKQNEIKRLNKLARDLIDESNQDQTEQMSKLKKNYDELVKKLEQKSDKIKQLNLRVQKLQRDLQDCRVQNQQLYLQNQINHEQAKGQYEKIANSNMKSLKQFYERRISDLESDKQQLKNKLSADQNSIAELVRKYQLLQNCMQKMIKQAKKRSIIEERVMNLGMDDNLVKNKAQLFSHHALEERQNLN